MLFNVCLFSVSGCAVSWCQSDPTSAVWNYQTVNLGLNVKAEITSGQITALLEATGNTEVEAFYPIIFANFLSNPEKVAELIATPGGSGGGGGGGGGGGDAAAEEEEEEEKEEEEEEAAPMGDMFGGDDGGDY